ncbi:hypothetical protein ACIPSK_20640 [Rhizobium sp. LARHSG275]|uniref:hypothetical protein n=1 Tax=Rhizobium TaxID=379 RepID=UPI0013894F89|nr:hypothetical protein [Rhizobium laguerreae]NDK52676.1 hypothetical protein [Rhizobium laguerreae]
MFFEQDSGSFTMLEKERSDAQEALRILLVRVNSVTYPNHLGSMGEDFDKTIRNALDRLEYPRRFAENLRESKSWIALGDDLLSSRVTSLWLLREAIVDDNESMGGDNPALASFSLGLSEAIRRVEILRSEAIAIWHALAEGDSVHMFTRLAFAEKQVRTYRRELLIRSDPKLRPTNWNVLQSLADRYGSAAKDLNSMGRALRNGSNYGFEPALVNLRKHLNLISNSSEALIATPNRGGMQMDYETLGSINIVATMLRELLNIFPRSDNGETAAVELERVRLPSSAPPSQVSGPHFAIIAGKLDFGPPDELDPAKNNIARLRSLLPMLRQQVREALELFGGNQPFPQIYAMIHEYGTALESAPELLDYNVLAGYGLLLANAESAALRNVRDRLSPEMEDGELAALRSILDLHGPFILSTEAGRNFLSDAAIYKRTPEEEATFREASVELTQGLSEDGIAADRAASFLTETAGNIGIGSQPTRTALFGTNTVRNVSIALIVGAIATLPAAIGLVTGSTTAFWFTAVFAAEGLKRSHVGNSAANALRDAVNDPTQRKSLMKLAPFILRFERQFRTIAGDQRELKPLHDWLDWLKANASLD